MKKILVLVLMLSIVQTAYAGYTRGYYRSDGTYVNGYYRTRPNRTTIDNYSTRGNYNPYTGRRGTASPYRYPRPYRPRLHRRYY